MRPTRRQRLALTVLVLASLTFIAVDYRVADGGAVGGLRSAVAYVAGPAQQALGSLGSPFSAPTPEQDQLLQDNQRLRDQLRSAQLDQGAAEQLRQLTLLAGAGGYRFVPARVIGVGATSGLEWTVTIDAGARDGLRTGMTVVNGEGLVGRVKRTAGATSLILLAIDRLSAVGCRLEGSAELGLARGNGLRPMDLQLLDPQARIEVGERLVTGPAGQSTFVPGVPIGTVTSVSRSTGAPVRNAMIDPYVNFTALDLVGVIVASPLRDPRDSVLPPKPTPAK